MSPEDPEALVCAIGRRIAELRIERGLTQEKFAEHLGVHARYVAKLEAGEQNFSVHSLVKVATGLGVRAVDLFVAPKSLVVRRGRPAGKSGARTSPSSPKG